jgi:hypothetical protein
LLHEFSKEASHVVTTLLPAFSEVGKIPIKLAGLLTRLALGKLSSSEPTLHCAGTYADSSGDGGLAHAKLAQSNHLLVVGQTFLSPGLLDTFKVGGTSNSAGLVPSGSRLNEQFLGLLLPLRR